jgi:glutamyl-tRNA synthetase
VLRSEDLDGTRVRREFSNAIIEDLQWLGIRWQEGPDCGGPLAPYLQSERTDWYRQAFKTLREAGLIYSCSCSRQDVIRSASAPHGEDDEPIYPGTCRNRGNSSANRANKARVLSWRFRVPDGRAIEFIDGHFGRQRLIAGKDFGDFVIWRQDNVPAYQLAVVVDDAAMQITEVVRGADLLRSTARQLLLYEALALSAPSFYHCPLVTDEKGVRLAKRNDALSLRTLREGGVKADSLIQDWQNQTSWLTKNSAPQVSSMSSGPTSRHSS